MPNVSKKMNDISEIAKYFEGQSIFLTGGTDLLGICLLEKLLRSCPQLDKIYLLIKCSDDEDFQKKCNKLYENNIFEMLKENSPNFKDKIKPVKGDLMENKLGLDQNDYKSLTEKVSIIFHNGAAGKLNEKLKVILNTNVLGTQRMLELARDCKHLKTFVFVSSCYSATHHLATIDDKFYSAPADVKMISDMIVAETQSGITDESLNMLLGNWTNIYAFTKATAEEMVQNCGRRSNFTCCVFRPSTVISTYREPVAGWCDNKNKAANLLVKLATGAIQVLYDDDEYCDLVPADLCANAMIVSAWDASERWKIEPQAYIYNYGTNKVKGITMSQIKQKMMDDSNVSTIKESTHSPSVILTKNYLIYIILRILLDYIPALVTDGVSIVFGKPPKSWSAVRDNSAHIHYLENTISGSWRVKIPSITKAYKRLNSHDQQEFGCDLETLNWDEFFLAFWSRIKETFLRDSPDGSQTKKCKKCPCKCPCIGYALLLLVGLFIYFGMSALLAD